MNGLVIKEGVLERCTIQESLVEVPKGVHTIGAGAFKGCVSLGKVVLSETVGIIEKDGFKGCRKLREITFPHALHFIGDYAFHRCHVLRRVELPPTVTALGNCAFLYCDGLEEVVMPGVRSLGKQAFLNDVALQRIVVSGQLEASSIADIFTGCGKLETVTLVGEGVYDFKNAVEMMSSRSDVPALIKAIAKDIYQMMEIEDEVILKFRTNLRRVELPEGIRGIGKSCFYDKKGIISIRFPGSLKWIESKAFRNCINLEQVEFVSNDVEIHKDAFQNCTTLKTLVLADGTRYTLEGLELFQGRDIPHLVKDIHSQVLGNFAISGTTLLKYRGCEERVVVPYGVTAIGEKAFAGNETVDKICLPDTVTRIEESAFEDCVMLQTAQMPQGLLHLGKSAFENCVKLIRIILPDTLTEIGDSAFNRCRTLNDVQLGKNLRKIGERAFYNCESLRQIAFPQGLQSIEDMAFYRCLSLREIVLVDSLRKLGNMVFTLSGIRYAVIGCQLEDCGKDVFSQCGKLERLVFEEGVRHIGDKFAFRCEKLLKVELPATLETVGQNAFEGSLFLAELPMDGIFRGILWKGDGYSGDVIISGSVTVIAGGAFYGNENITSVILPDSVKWVGGGAFCGCAALRLAILPEHLRRLEKETFAHCSALESVKSSGRLVFVGAGTFRDDERLWHIPSLEEGAEIEKEAVLHCKVLDGDFSGCSKFGDRALEGTAVLYRLRQTAGLVILGGTVLSGADCAGEVIIPEGTVAVADFAFFGNDQICNIMFPKSLTEIGERAFGGCVNLRTVQFQGSVKRFENGAFEKCGALKEIVGRVMGIGKEAFAWCGALDRVSIAGVREIEAGTFRGCGVLREAWLPQVESIESGAFENCASLEQFDFSAVKYIGKRAFYGNDSLFRIALKEGAVLDSHAFEDCGRLEQVDLSGENVVLESYAFSGCTALKTVMLGGKPYRFGRYQELFNVGAGLPQTVKRVFESVFSCFAIDAEFVLTAYENAGRYVTVPEGVTGISEEVFRDRARLTFLNIPQSVHSIGSRAFHGTEWLELEKKKTSFVVVNGILTDASGCGSEAVISPEITCISGWAFANCFSLHRVVFLGERTMVEAFAFRNCINLKELVTADGAVYHLEKLSDREKPLPVLVKRIFMDCFNCFKTDGIGKLVECTGNIVNLTLPQEITEIGDSVFQDSNLLTVIRLTENVTEIGEGAFRQCKWLTDVEEAGCVKRIGLEAFSGCIRLRTAGDFRSLEMLGERAFENCVVLEEFFVPEGVTEIPKRAFYRCHRLRRVILPSTLKQIGEEAFAFCYSLAEVLLPDGLERIGNRAFAWCQYMARIELPKGIRVAEDAFQSVERNWDHEV